MITKRDIQYLNKAVEAAKYSKLRVRVGAYFAKTGHGTCNERKTHPRLAQWGFHPHSDIHAEIAMVIANTDELHGETIYVARLLRNGEWAMSRPCPACMAVLIKCEVKRIVWTTGPNTGDSVKI